MFATTSRYTPRIPGSDICPRKARQEPTSSPPGVRDALPGAFDIPIWPLPVLEVYTERIARADCSAESVVVLAAAAWSLAPGSSMVACSADVPAPLHPGHHAQAATGVQAAGAWARYVLPPYSEATDPLAASKGTVTHCESSCITECRIASRWAARREGEQICTMSPRMP